jgi:DNA-directed RNA polymerase subunit M/transcription elongation factor TFIIS
MPEKTFKQVCECENCGNEAEMTITCTLETEDARPVAKPAGSETTDDETKGKTKGSGVCSQCGNEADMWIDY